MTVRILVIAGPTATGKTRLGVEVAHALDSEILSADSRQVYRGLDLGTGKDLDEYAAVDPPVPYHLIDLVDPTETYTLFRYQQDCYEVIERLARRPAVADGSVPLVMVGGSGLYIEAMVRSFRITDVPRDPELRRRLEGRPLRDLVALLRAADAELAATTDLANQRRVIRALEVSAAAARGPIRRSRPTELDLDWRVVALTSDLTALRRTIRRRLDARLAAGMIDEVRGLLEGGLPPERLTTLGLEYREIGAYLAGRKERSSMLEDLAVAIGRFAKRQGTWLRGMERRGTPITWIEPGDGRRALAEIRHR